MKWFTFVLLLGLWTTACQRTPPVSQEPDNPEVAITEPEPDPGNPIKTGTVQSQPSLLVHSSPGTDTPVLYDAPYGIRLEIFAETAMGDSTWYQVRSDLSPELGWAYGGNIAVDGEENLTPDRPPNPPIKSGTVQAQPSLRIHTAPGTDTPVIYAAPNGTRLEIFAETAMGDSTWYQVSSNLSPQLGWAYGGNIVVDGQENLTSDRPPPPEPSQPDRPPPTDNLSMTCTGTLSNGSTFTVNYTREAGFSRFTLNSGNAEPMTASLSYSGTTEAQHGVWKGQLSESEVRVDHLSNQAAKPGDEITVIYNIFNGRTVCR
ncbi:MAG: SH3 domain-containing protein [Spirulina sp.]